MSKDKYEFTGDCLDLEIENLSLCDKNVHGREFGLVVHMHLAVSVDQLRELAKFNDGLCDAQFWTLELKKCENKEEE